MSYCRVLSISTELDNKVIDQFNHHKVVCPPSLKVGTFTTAAIDKIEHSTSSNTATSSFDGTAVLFFQHPSLGKSDERKLSDFQIKEKKVKKLLFYYRDIEPAVLNKTITIQEPNVLKDTPNNIPSTKTSSNDTHEEEWPECAAECIEKATDYRLDLSWSTFNADKIGSPKTNPDTTAMMRIYCEDSKSAAMIKHLMDMIWKADNHLNKGQPIAAALYQPLYAIA